jgi:type I restriction enzyme S subunit
VSLFASELGRFVNITTGKLDANAAVEDGQFPFFTCSRSALQIDNYAFDTDAVLVAGNGDLNVKHYNGKFNAYQRTYVITISDHLKLDSRYLYYFMDKYVERLREQSIGGVIKYIKLGMLTEAKIPLPPLTEQKRIAAILDKADTIRRKRQQAIQLADDFLRAVFLDMFGDPVTNPKGWEVKILGDMFELKHGFAFKSENFVKEGEYILLTPGNFFEKGGFRHRGEKQRYHNSPVPEGYVLEQGDLLVAMTEQAPGLLGSPIFIPESTKYLHNQRLGKVVKKTKINSQYIFALMNAESIRARIQKDSTGTKVKHTSPKKIAEIKVGVPPLDLQHQFANIIKKIEQHQVRLCKHLTKLDTLFASLQQRAFRGEL